MVHAIFVIAVIGFIVWAFNIFVPMDGRFKQVIIGLACLIAFFVLLQALGIDTGVNAKL